MTDFETPDARRKIHACPAKILRVLPRILIEGDNGSLDLLLVDSSTSQKIECDCGRNPKLPKRYADLGKVASGCRSETLPPQRFNNQSSEKA